MNPVQIEKAISEFAIQSFDAPEFASDFLAACDTKTVLTG